MSTNPFSLAASGLTSGLTLVVRICEITYALKAVDEQTEEYLKTVEHVTDNLNEAKRLRRDSSPSLGREDKATYDRDINQAEEAATAMAVLLEPARVDKMAEQKIKLSTRGQWVFSNNQTIVSALGRLQIAYTTLMSTVQTLRMHRFSHQLAPSESRHILPPTYANSNPLNAKRASKVNLRKHASTDTFQSYRTYSSDQSPPLPSNAFYQEPGTTHQSLQPNHSQHSPPQLPHSGASIAQLRVRTSQSAQRHQEPSARPFHPSQSSSFDSHQSSTTSSSTAHQSSATDHSATWPCVTSLETPANYHHHHQPSFELAGSPFSGLHEMPSSQDSLPTFSVMTVQAESGHYEAYVAGEYVSSSELSSNTETTCGELDPASSSRGRTGYQPGPAPRHRSWLHMQAGRVESPNSRSGSETRIRYAGS